MPDMLRLVIAFASGLALGLLFFLGLWWTVRRSLNGTHPAAWILTSLLVRTAILLAGFYLVARGNWQRFVACAFGFVAARLIVTFWLLPAKTGNQQAHSHAP